MNIKNIVRAIFGGLGIFFAAGLAHANLSSSIDDIITNQAGDMQVGVYVEDTSTGRVLYDNNGSRPMTPASTTKVFTAAAAYLYLGPEYQYTTKLETNAPLQGSTLNGNLYFVFSGDPTLTSKDINDLVVALKEKGISQIKGNVMVDDSVFSGPYYGLGWPQDNLVYCYAAPVSGAIINNNCMAVRIIKARGHQIPEIKQYATSYKVENDLRLVGRSSLKTCVFQPSITGNKIILQGCLPRRGQWSLAFAVQNPETYAEQVVSATLKRNHISISNGKVLVGMAPQDATLIASHTSKSLQTILSYMLKHSDNVYAGAIGKTLGNAYYGVGSYKSGVNAINAILTTRLGDDFKPVYLEDSSGLSVYNLVSAKQLVQVLGYMYRESELSDTFMKSLAICGHPGTLSYRLNKWPLVGHIYGKTGTINGVSTLAGYVALPDHPTLTFAIMMNDVEGGAAQARAMQDRIVQAIAQNT